MRGLAKVARTGVAKDRNTPFLLIPFVFEA